MRRLVCSLLSPYPHQYRNLVVTLVLTGLSFFPCPVDLLSTASPPMSPRRAGSVPSAPRRPPYANHVMRDRQPPTNCSRCSSCTLPPGQLNLLSSCSCHISDLWCPSDRAVFKNTCGGGYGAISPPIWSQPPPCPPLGLMYEPCRARVKGVTSAYHEEVRGHPIASSNVASSSDSRSEAATSERMYRLVS